jgi:hypothetical protein
LLDNSSIDVNSVTNAGLAPIMRTLRYGNLASSKLLVERGANLFLKNNDGKRAIDIRLHNFSIRLGPHVLLHAKELRWSAIKELTLLSKACLSPDRRVVANISMSMDTNDEAILSRYRSARLVASILGCQYVSRKIASYIIRSDIIVRDKSIPKPPDAVKLRVEATLKAAASSSSSKKRGRETE